MAKRSTAKTISDFTTVLGTSTELAGTLKFDTSLMIRGRFDGAIYAKGELYIDENAIVSVTLIQAMSVVVAGTVRGDIEAIDKVEFRPTAKIYGNVKTAKLRISDGVIFEGRCEMIKDASNFDPFAIADTANTPKKQYTKDITPKTGRKI